MRAFAVFLSWFFIAGCYALKIIALESPVIDAAPYTTSGQVPWEQETPPNEGQDFPLPVTSRITPGTVHTHFIKNSAFPQSLFVVGDDPLSRTWLKTHALRLQQIKALGFVTNVTTSKALHELSELAGRPLQPVVVDELALLLNVNHYPLAFNLGVVWQ